MGHRAEEKSGISGKDVAAFLFLPQFWRSFEHFSHIGPIFVRTLAIMFEQAGLIAQNHPATMYGAPDVQRVGVRALLGEAWFTLRHKPGATPYQWGLFASVVAMITTIFSSLGLLVLHMMAGFSAHAQLFQHPVAAATIVPTGTTNPLFNTAQTSPDLALDLLNKLLRQSSIASGGALQQALGPLLNTYNTAVMVIAAFVLFWAVMAVVIDTAHTGKVGGGHNMVWTPIRFAFALGLMIPVGAGFNSGQIIVLKLAEWGSNLGTNAWSTYVASVANPSLISALPQQQVMNAMVGFAKVNTCRTAYNIYMQQALPGNPAPTPPYSISIFRATDAYESADIETYFYKNQDGSNCGSITMKVPNPAVSKPTMFASITNWFSSATPAIDAFEAAVRTAERNAFLAQEARAMQIACEMSLVHITGMWPNAMCSGTTPLGLNVVAGGGGTLPVTYDATPGTKPCGAVVPAAGTGTTYPTEQCIIDMTNNFQAATAAAITGARTALEGAVSGGAFMTEVTNAGWGGMGLWYHKVSHLNVSAQKAVSMTVQVNPQNAISGTSEHVAKVNSILTDFNRWWDEKSVRPTTAANATIIKAQRRSFSAAGTGIQGLPTMPKMEWSTFSSISGIASLLGYFVEIIGYGSNLGMGAILNTVFGGNGALLIEINSYNQGTYPMAELARIGNALINKTIGAYTLIAIFSAIPILQGVMAGPVGSLLGTIAMAGYAGGVTLAYFLPLIPWMRVMFAMMGWLATTFEAVVAVPFVALGHLNTKGDGLAGNMVNAYKQLAMLLFRPVLIVAGFVGALLLFNTMVLFVNDTFNSAIHASIGGSVGTITAELALTIAYVSVMYSLVNSTFKLVDMVPAAVGAWFGTSVSTNQFGKSTFAQAEGMMGAGALLGQSAAKNLGEGAAGAGAWAGSKIGGMFSKGPKLEDATPRSGSANPFNTWNP